jgi:hypothetical protein
MKGFIAKMTIRLNQITHLRTGAPFRERIVHNPLANYLVVQAKDIGTDGAINLHGMIRTEPPNKKAPDTLRPGEVVLQTRGMSYRAAVISEAPAPMIAAGSLFILTADTSRISPDYLVLFLNLPATQTELRQKATGSTIPNLRRAAIEQLEVPLPSLEDQARIVELASLVHKQSEITERINQLRLQELHALMIERAKKAGGTKPPASNRSERRGKRPQTLS